MRTATSNTKSKTLLFAAALLLLSPALSGGCGPLEEDAAETTAVAGVKQQDNSQGGAAESDVKPQAQLFDWNSCYSKTSGFLSYSGCLEQWGSYPLACVSTFDSTGYAAGKRCKHVCDKGTCGSGCFSNYDSLESANALASAYKCSE